MKNRKMIERGAYVAIGVLLGYAVILPRVSEVSQRDGIGRGVIGAVLTVFFFALLGALWPGKADDHRGDDDRST